VLDRTRRAEQAIAQSQVVVGYGRYLELIEDITAGKEIVTTGMTKEVERCKRALELAGQGNTVALVSSGDAGIYGMAGLAIELIHTDNLDIHVEVVPGVTASSAAGARLGAPLMLDYACISLSDLLVPWKTVIKRLEGVASADLVVALYNPRSKKRIKHLDEAANIFCKYRPLSTPVGVATSVGTEDEKIVISDLEHFREEEIGMRSIVLVGNTTSRRMGNWLVTPRGYHV